ncbi:MAG: S24/S26 family peptidase [Candidatus Moraniibacteriota bacterium]
MAKLKKSSVSEKFFALLFLVVAVILIFKLIEHKQRENRMEYFVGQGDSMLPTIEEGNELAVDPEAEIKEDDIIVFTCPECKVRQDDIDILTKRLIAKDEKGCFWVEGDNEEKSHDSRDFGWLCPNEIELHGKVVGVKEESGREVMTD